MFKVRFARRDEVDTLIAMEAINDNTFAEFGIPVSDVQLYGREVFEEAQALGNNFIVTDDKEVIAFAMWREADGCAYLAEIDVAPSHQKQGIGSMLLEHLCEYLSERKYTQIFLTTFRDLPFNMPWYEKFGFRVVDAADVGPDMKAIWQHEIDCGLMVAPRVIMRRDL